MDLDFHNCDYLKKVLLFKDKVLIKRRILNDYINIVNRR